MNSRPKSTRAPGFEAATLAPNGWWRTMSAHRLDARSARAIRLAIEAMDILEPVPAVPGRARLLFCLDCKGPAMAGTILPGEHIGKKVWQAKPDLQVVTDS